MAEHRRWWITMPPQPGEEIICVKTGAVPIPGTGLPLIGGILVLSNLRLYHGPLNTRWAATVLSHGLKLPEGTTLLAQVSGTLADEAKGGLFDKVSEWANRARAVPLAEIIAVEPCRRSSIKITTRDQESREFAVGAGRIAPVWAPENIAARDELLAAIEAARGR